MARECVPNRAGSPGRLTGTGFAYKITSTYSLTARCVSSRRDGLTFSQPATFRFILWLEFALELKCSGSEARVLQVHALFTPLTFWCSFDCAPSRLRPSHRYQTTSPNVPVVHEFDASGWVLGTTGYSPSAHLYDLRHSEPGGE